MMNEQKNNLDKYSSTVNPSELWNAIEPRVDEFYKNKKKKKRRFLFIILFGLASCLIAFGIYAITKDGTNSTTTSETKVLNKEQTRITSTTNESTKSRMGFNEEKTNKSAIKSKDNSRIKTTSSNNTSSDLQQQKSVEQNTSSIAKNKTNLVDKAIQSNHLDATKEKEIVHKKTHSSSVDISISKTDSTDDVNIKFMQVEESSSTKTANTSNSQSLEKNIAKNTQHTSDKSSSITPFITLEQVPHLNNLTVNYIDFSEELSLNTKNVETAAYSKKSNQSSRNLAFSVSAFGGYSFINRKLEALSNSSSSYKALRENSEEGLEATHMGFEFSGRHISGFNFSFGLTQTQINERFDTRAITQDSTIVNDVRYLVINLNGDTNRIYGPIPVTTTTDTKYEVYNSQKLLELPFLVGYGKPLGKWHVGARAGLLVNLSLKRSGTIFNDDGVVTTFKDELPGYRTSLGLGYQFDLFLERSLGERLSFGLYPSVKIYPNMAESTYQLSDKYTLFGGNIGLRYLLN